MISSISSKKYLSLLIKHIRLIIHFMEKLKQVFRSRTKDLNDKKENDIPIYDYPLEYLKNEFPYEYENVIRNRRSRCFW
ncbi:hypothetical protein J5U23_00653 [Saccharolobus shibatae B12]|uniref:Uncharacterized protein n=2 Tax=Saccharolobus shibatae TaxID=2286 RepID=A0A8F5BM20_SACSH|nr:hypothetical protein J5U23_00653 [Saccharolobus shibatae B12]QXJ31129.1 hypothetical protein J5U21_00778 [Saccharolobus shibatae]